MKTNFKAKLYDLLKKDSRLWDEEKKEFNETLLKDLIDKLDEKLIELLLGDKETNKKFFVKIKDVLVLKQNELKFFIDENKLDNSYTQYKNKIGLRIGNNLLSERDEVVLDWPFKDCVLEGGMTKEDQKRNEIFFNEILAKDEIDRLFDPKALVNWKRYTAKGERKVKELKRDKGDIIRENLIIKGNNLLALHSLKEQFTGKVKLIYIDPPYNTGNDGFKYNNNFNHSTWLTFMKNRLEIAKDLLREDGFITIQCDDYEQAYLKALMDNTFGRDNFRNSIYWHRTYAGKTVSKNLPWNVDIIHLFTKSINTNINNVTSQLTEKDISSYTKDDNDGRGKYATVSLQKTGGPGPLTTYDYVDNSGKIWKCPKKGWRMRQEKLKALENDNRLYINGNTIREKYYLKERQKIGKQIDNFWSDIGNLNRQSDMSLGLTGQKPEGLLKRIFELTTEENDIILDFFAGSGTTGAVAHKMNRQYILIEQMDYIHDLPKTRLKKVIDGEQRGISKSVNWHDGGDFVYFELAKWNEEAKEKIFKTKSLTGLERLFDELYERYFLNYNVKTKEFKDKILKEEGFKNLSLDEQKNLFVEMLDMNQMYVNFSERADKKYNLSEKDIKLSEEFYLTK